MAGVKVLRPFTIQERDRINIRIIHPDFKNCILYLDVNTHRSMLSPEKARRSRSLISWRHSLPERSESASDSDARSGHRGTAGSRKDTKEIILKSLEIQGIAEVIFIERCFL